MVSAKPCGFVSDPMEKGDRISTGLSPTQNRPVNPRLSLDFFYDQKSAPTRVTSSRGYWIANFDFTNMLQCYSSTGILCVNRVASAGGQGCMSYSAVQPPKRRTSHLKGGTQSTITTIIPLFTPYTVPLHS